jgi:alpha-tubulin suppressor-like RCC1 family protein
MRVVLSRRFGYVKGRVYTWGEDHDILGHGVKESLPKPKLIQLKDDRSPFTEYVTKVATGISHTALITETNALYTFGDTTYGQLGREGSGLAPGLAQLEKVHEVACGRDFTIALTTMGDLYSWGWAKGKKAWWQKLTPFSIKGCLGYEENGIVKEPRKIEALADQFVVQIAAGHQHALALTRKVYSRNGEGVCVG